MKNWPTTHAAASLSDNPHSPDNPCILYERNQPAILTNKFFFAANDSMT